MMVGYFFQLLCVVLVIVGIFLNLCRANFFFAE